jgi:hypothetical protein
MATPKGYYVYKFDKSGNKIWESINKIDDPNFKKGQIMIKLFVDLFEYNNNLCFTIKLNGLSDFFNYNFIDKVSGKTIKNETLKFNETFADLDDTNNNIYKINSTFKNDKDFKNKKFNFNSIIALNSNQNILEYIKKVKSKNDLYFHCNFSDKGVWLYEESEDEYYKVVFFKY